jgi:pyrimidine operon attenuation protein/uracil phosphoribosyltransferase
MSGKNYVLSREAADYKMRRMALELAENLEGDNLPVVIIGVRNSGSVIAAKIAEYLRPYVANDIQVLAAVMDKQHPVSVTLSEAVDFNDKHIVIADDVTNSGRTLLYALKPLLAYFPKSIQTLVLVERMHKHFPVNPDYVGLSVATTQQDHIQVEVENGEVLGAYIA